MTNRQHIIIIITVISIVTIIIITIIIIVFQITCGECDTYLRLKDLHLQLDYLCCGSICISSGELQLSFSQHIACHEKTNVSGSFDLMEKEE